MIRRLLGWLVSDRFDLGSVPGWDTVRADRAAADTARLLLGHAGPSKVVGSRMAEERERKLAQRRLRVVRAR